MFARTERLLLRPGWIEDASALALAISDDAVIEHLGISRDGFDTQSAAHYLARAQDAASPDLLILLRTEAEPLVIGGIGIEAREHMTGHFSFWIAREHRGSGYAVEAGRAMIGIAEHALGLRSLSATPFVDNEAGAKVLGRLGFEAGDRIVQRCAGRDALAPARLHTKQLLSSNVTRRAPLAA